MRPCVPGALLLCLPLAGACGYRLSRVEPPPMDAFAPPPPGLALVCLLRPRLAPSKLVFVVRDNGRLVGATVGSSYFCYYAEPGPHRITSQRTGVIEETVKVLEAGQRYYLYQNVDPYPDATRSWLSWTSEQEARGMVGECTYRVLTSVPRQEQAPGRQPRAPADPTLARAAAEPTSSPGTTEGPSPVEPPPAVQEPIDAKAAPDPPVRKRRRR
ncbi:MAG: hypothetical protein RMK29_03505 [Myxococcales bacterium]|nr:hypothetical protein [Myxococcota bacterium]MDW8280752.1 hypothetical protein [Myxococcales bacterium]